MEDGTNAAVVNPEFTELNNFGSVVHGYMGHSNSTRDVQIATQIYGFKPEP